MSLYWKARDGGHGGAAWELYMRRPGRSPKRVGWLSRIPRKLVPEEAETGRGKYRWYLVIPAELGLPYVNTVRTKTWHRSQLAGLMAYVKAWVSQRIDYERDDQSSEGDAAV